jgi:hypothetical protein
MIDGDTDCHHPGQYSDVNTRMVAADASGIRAGAAPTNGSRSLAPRTKVVG